MTKDFDWADLTSITSYFWQQFNRTEDGTFYNSEYLGSLIDADPPNGTRSGRGEEAAEPPVSGVIAERYRLAPRLGALGAVDRRTVLEHPDPAVVDETHPIDAEEAAGGFERTLQGGELRYQ